MFLINSRLDLFTAASLRWRPFSRSYGPILPSSLAMNLSSTLELSSQLPVSVCGTGCLACFSWKMICYIITAAETLVYYHTSPRSADLPTVPIATCFNELFRQFAVLSLLRHPIAIIRSTGILTCYPSTTPFGFALGPD